MGGPVILLGGAEFTPVYRDLDRSLLDESGASKATILPTAAAYEQPDRFVDAARAHFGELGAGVCAVPVLTRSDAEDEELADAVAGARLVYLTDGSSMHLESVLKRSAVWDAVVGAHRAGAVVVASGGAARVVCDPMVDPRGGAFMPGFGLVRNVAFVPSAESWSEDREHRTRSLLQAGVDLHVVASGDHVRLG